MALPRENRQTKVRKEQRAKLLGVQTRKRSTSQVTKNLLDKNEEIQERMVPGRGGKGLTEANAVK